MAGHVQQRIDREHAHALRTWSDQHDLVASPYFAFLQHTEIEARPTVRDQQCGHLRLVHADPHPIAGDARLRHFEQSAANSVTIANANFLVRQALDCEVFSKLPIDEVAPTEPALPIVIRLDLIDEDSPLLAAVPVQVPLPIAVDVEPPCHAPTLNWRLPDGGADSLAPPGDVARQTHIDGKQSCHHILPGHDPSIRPSERRHVWCKSDASLGVEWMITHLAIRALSSDPVDKFAAQADICDTTPNPDHRELERRFCRKDRRVLYDLAATPPSIPAL